MQDVLLGLDCLGICAIKILFHEAIHLSKGSTAWKMLPSGGNRQAGLPRTLRVHLSARFLFGASEGGDSDVWLGIVPCGGRRTSFSVRREATSPAEWSNVCCSCGGFAACNRLFSCSKMRVMAALREDISCAHRISKSQGENRCSAGIGT